MNTVKIFVTAVFILMISIQLTFAQGTQITILHTSDSHSHLDATVRRTGSLRVHSAALPKQQQS
ncbi:MAG: hypothetical protein R3A12_03680 [Ignavibacteria bacterium]